MSLNFPSFLTQFFLLMLFGGFPLATMWASPLVNILQAPQLQIDRFTKGVAIGDFDSDGRDDIVSAYTFATDGVAISRNLGANKFSDPIRIVIPSFTIEATFVYDLDGDGKLDLIASSSLNDKIVVFRNASSGGGSIAFQPGVQYVTGGNQARSIAIVDFDGDGLADIGVASRDSNASVSIFRNLSSGNGILLAPRVDLPAAGVWNIVASDIDLDGKPDIVVGGSSSSRSVRVLRNTSSPANLSFETSTSFPIHGGATGIAAGDLDGDGRPDVVASNQNNDDVSILRNATTSSGPITFASRLDMSTGPAPSDVVMADFNLDGKIDIATSNSNGNSFSILENSSSPGSTSFAPRVLDFGVGLGPVHLAAGDFDENGRTDLVISNQSAGTISIAVNISQPGGRANFASRKDYLTPLKAPVTNLDGFDFDVDGDVDLAVSFNNISNVFRISIYRNNGQGDFTDRLDVVPVPPSYITGVEPTYLACGDLDGDGLADIALLAEYFRFGIFTQGILVFRNVTVPNGAPSFQFVETSFTFQSPLELKTADLDGDGKLDLIATYEPNIGPSEAGFVLRNTSVAGSISFSQAGAFTVSGLRVPVVVSDFNADGKTDFGYVNTSELRPSVTIQVNNGSGPGSLGFSPQNIAIENFSFASLVVCDLDNDSRNDLVTMGTEVRLSAFQNLSSGGDVTLGPEQTFTASFMSVVAGSVDLNNDGTKDVVGLNSAGYLGIYRNISTFSTLTFETEQQLPVGGNDNADSNVGAFGGIEIADFNGDGRPDIAQGYRGASIGLISVLLTPGSVTVSGFVRGSDGRGVRGGVVTVSGGNLSAPVFVNTGQIGFYSVSGLQAGQTYLVSVAARRFRFTPASVTPIQNVSNFNLTAAGLTRAESDKHSKLF